MSRIVCRVADSEIQPAEVFETIREPGHGAQNFFFGAVRATNWGRNVVAVAYDAFEPLAEKVLREICQEAQAKWGQDLQLCVIHRTGKLSVGELSVGIGVSSTHRDESYQASRYVIEQLKIRAPIWKKEFYDTGESEWLKGHALCQHAPDGEAKHHHE